MKLTQARLLTIAAVLECLAGLAFALAPGAAVAVLFGAEPLRDGLMLGRLAGVALLSLAIACWGARADRGSSTARTGTLRAITFYNAGAGMLLIVWAATSQADGPVAWSVGILHLALASAFAVSLRRSEKAPSVRAR
jgi:hypothetical protein